MPAHSSRQVPPTRIMSNDGYKIYGNERTAHVTTAVAYNEGKNSQPVGGRRSAAKWHAQHSQPKASLNEYVCAMF